MLHSFSHYLRSNLLGFILRDELILIHASHLEFRVCNKTKNYNMFDWSSVKVKKEMLVKS